MSFIQSLTDLTKRVLLVNAILDDDYKTIIKYSELLDREQFNSIILRPEIIYNITQEELDKINWNSLDCA